LDREDPSFLKVIEFINQYGGEERKR